MEFSLQTIEDGNQGYAFSSASNSKDGPCVSPEQKSVAKAGNTTSAAATIATPWFKKAHWKSTPEQVERELFAAEYLDGTALYHVLRARAKRHGPLFLHRNLLYLNKRTKRKVKGGRRNRPRLSTSIEWFHEHHKFLDSEGIDADADIVGNAKYTRPATLPRFGLTPIGQQKDGVNMDGETDVVKSIHYQCLKSMSVTYQFHYCAGRLYQEQKVYSFLCPWCNLHCMTLPGLLLHLKLSHDRFSYTCTQDPDGSQHFIAVRPDDSSSIAASEDRTRCVHLAARIADLHNEISALERAATDKGRKSGYCLSSGTSKKKKGSAAREELCIGDAGAVTLTPGSSPPDGSAAQFTTEDRSEGAPSAWLLPMLQRRLAKLEKTLREQGDFLLDVPRHVRGAAMLRAHAHVFTAHASPGRVPPPHHTPSGAPPGTPRGKGGRRGKKRQYYHSATFLPIEASMEEDLCDSEEEVDNQWLLVSSQRLLDDVEDLNGGEKQMMTLWNAFMFDRKQIKANDLKESNFCNVCESFVARHGSDLVRQHLRQNFVLHLMTLADYGLLQPQDVKSILQRPELSA
eukprot:m.324167 g.324167  ORF g.324167 m.324167 type:complete len:570 (+) comp20369_c0_seq4:161-1870(+)